MKGNSFSQKKPLEEVNVFSQEMIRYIILLREIDQKISEYGMAIAIYTDDLFDTILNQKQSCKEEEGGADFFIKNIGHSFEMQLNLSDHKIKICEQLIEITQWVFNIINSAILTEERKIEQELLVKDLAPVTNKKRKVRNSGTWCFCQEDSFKGDMIQCSNWQCKYQWFHIACFNIQLPMEEEWFCSKECYESYYYSGTHLSEN